MSSNGGTVYDDKLDQLVERAELVIFETRSLLPFIYPHTLTICPNRVTVTNRSLVSRNEYPIPIESVTGARVFRHMFFASLSIETFGFEKPEPISYMKPHEARLARRYILALVECKKEKIDLSGFSLSELKKRLKNIGMVRESSGNSKYHQI